MVKYPIYQCVVGKVNSSSPLYSLPLPDVRLVIESEKEAVEQKTGIPCELLSAEQERRVNDVITKQWEMVSYDLNLENIVKRFKSFYVSPCDENLSFDRLISAPIYLTSHEEGMIFSITQRITQTEDRKGRVSFYEGIRLLIDGSYQTTRLSLTSDTYGELVFRREARDDHRIGVASYRIEPICSEGIL